MTGTATGGPAGGPPMRGDDPEDPLERRLGDLVREWPDLAGAAGIYRVTLPLLRNARPVAAPIPLTEDQARRKLAEGDFLLHGVALAFDRGRARELMLGLARSLEAAGRTAVSPIRAALEGDRLALEELLGDVSAGDYPSLAARAEAEALDPALLWTLAQSALKPTLRAWCGERAPLVRAAGAWEKACCFLCGAPAALGELQGNEGARHLRCGQCGADWPARRLQCVYCGNEDASLLGVLSPENGRGNARVDVCDKCRGYLKVITRFAPSSPEELAVEDLSTLFLDCLARERGYRRPPLRRDGGDE